MHKISYPPSSLSSASTVTLDYLFYLRYNFCVHILQQKLLKLSREVNLGNLALREIGRMIGETSPQKIKHHLQQLEKRGLIRIDKGKRIIEKTEQGFLSGLLKQAQLLAIPILGSANAGPAELFAEQNVEGYLNISSTFLGSRSKHQLFAVKVDGLSMNRAEIDGKRIESGDYVIVDADENDPKDGQIVLSIIGGMANIKRLRMDRKHQQIALTSDSTQDFPPIYIHESDEFYINGTVIQVIKKAV
jgi:repressor LexA